MQASCQILCAIGVPQTFHASFRHASVPKGTSCGADLGPTVCSLTLSPMCENLECIDAEYGGIELLL